ncbi:MAG: DNA polymerase III subunit delta [Chthoniobacterales bacterium]|nr:DNA polymerase III subunit delta [Chthoniobacterales bacterium]
MNSSSLYFITGNDESEVRRVAQEKVLKLTQEDAGAFGLEIIETGNDTVETSLNALEETCQALLTFPFLSSGKLVWLKNITFLKDSPAGRSEAVQKGLEKLLSILQEGLPKGITFLISALEPDKRRTFFKGFSALATMTLCNQPDFGFQATEEDIVQWILERARSRNIRLEPQAAEVIAMRIGAESGPVEIELAKLATAAGEENTITEVMARNLVPMTRTGGIFDLSNAISSRNLPLALKVLKQLQGQGETSIGILLAAIVPTLRNLLLVKDLLQRHHLSPPSRANFFAATLQKLPPSETSHLPRKKEGTLNAYGLGLAAMKAHHYSCDELVKGFLACRDTNQQLLQGAHAEDVLLTQLVLKIVGNHSCPK